ncbi:MAG TPA: hypothetical protein VEA77_02385 [Hyphomicrobium sp.]|nr:hypothetical protein [Hyphomicrobium sp.]
MGDYWFKPKTYGYGAAPANWKGWAAGAGFIVATWVILWPWILSPALAGKEPSPAGIVATLALIAVVTLGFIWLCKVKTDGAWHWRWGGKT